MNELPREAHEEERLRYVWYTAYSRKDEYDKNPQWSESLATEAEESDEDYGGERIRFFDIFDPEHIWIRSDTTRDLNQMR